ncbi:MAG: four helix bundle protein [bacterium]|nr:MAG: four helix bundle protein [bacterium]
MLDFRKLKVWEKSHKLADDIYKMTQLFPKDSSMSSQIKFDAQYILFPV